MKYGNNRAAAYYLVRLKERGSFEKHSSNYHKLSRETGHNIKPMSNWDEYKEIEPHTDFRGLRGFSLEPPYFLYNHSREIESPASGQCTLSPP
jgi:hypothetical protein